MEKWKVGVNIFLRVRHLVPVLMERKVASMWAVARAHTWNDGLGSYTGT